MLLLKLFFHLLYHSFAWGYDLVAAVVSGGRWEAWVKCVIPLIRGENILELGIGTGHLQKALLESNLQPVGLDASRQMLRIANKRLQTRYPAARLLRARAENLPLPAASMDSIVATFPSEYILQPLTLQACRRVLRKGGRLVVLLGVQVGGSGLQSRLLRMLYRLTGQQTPDAVTLEKNTRVLPLYGFQTSIHLVNFRQDLLTFLVAN